MMSMTTTTSAEVKLIVLLASPTSAATSEELVEEVILIEAPTRVLSLILPLHPLLTMLIIDFALFRVRESLICVCNILEFFLCPLGIVLILVGVELDSHLFERFLYLFIGSAPLQPQYLIVVLLSVRHACREND